MPKRKEGEAEAPTARSVALFALVAQSAIRCASGSVRTDAKKRRKQKLVESRSRVKSYSLIVTRYSLIINRYSLIVTRWFNFAWGFPYSQIKPFFYFQRVSLSITKLFFYI
uniref:Uncharacterized protein n=1 Tax=Pediastrum angulosum TaxID=271408 RepID=A0A2U8GHL9_9CHLO|nr:hypothetical protein [Pediastrum angulosum]AWI68175.1 hypothetical protein [Pediastrum angulosum]